MPDTAFGYNLSDIARPKGPLSRSELYNAINAGKLRAKKYGKRTIVTPEAWNEFLASLPDYQPLAKEAA